jgi:drug/metabolite transporter (DMT)-like permease
LNPPYAHPLRHPQRCSLKCDLDREWGCGKNFIAVNRCCILSLLAGIITLLLISVSPKNQKRSLPSLAEIRLLWRPFLFVSLIRNVICFLTFDYALLCTSSAKVMFLTKMEPYLVLGLHAALYSERIARGDLLLLFIHVGGAILLLAGANLSVSFE